MEDIDKKEILETLRAKYQNKINTYDSEIKNKIRSSQICYIENNILSSISHKGGYFETAYDESCKIEDALEQEIKDLKSKKATSQTILDIIDMELQNVSD